MEYLEVGGVLFRTKVVEFDIDGIKVVWRFNGKDRKLGRFVLNRLRFE